ncbi:RES domain-containing protein [Uliginosibacterium sediminicola]|uniref:RES domain-containing protein n=1 Tax=Uliginosibacterium sediminicola TaxID=2024550 RepID=A0ABU9YT81_9RHOO
MPTITEQFPPLPLDGLIAEIAAFSTYTLDEKRAFIRRLVQVHPALNLDMNLTGRYFRRARKLEESDPLPNNVDEVIWRKDVPARLGRANTEGFSVLYLAIHTDTAFSETLAGTPDRQGRMVIADFAIQPGASIRVLPIGALHIVQRTGKGFFGESQKALNDMVNACDRTAAKSLLIADAFLFECLAKEDDYSVSSCVAMSIFNKLPSISAIAYPSKRQRFAINFAVRTDSFWDGWGLHAVRCGQAKHLAQGYFSFTPDNHVVGITAAGNFQWQEDLPTEGMRLPLEPLWTPS